MNGVIRAVLFDYAGVMTEDMFPVVAAHAVAGGATTEGLADLIFRGYGENSEHPMQRVERGEISLAELADWGRAQAASQGWTIDLAALLMSIIDLPIRPEMVERARALRRTGVQTALVTNTARETAERWRTKALADEIFDEVIDSSEVGLRKPDPAIFALTLERLGVATAEAVLLDDLQVNVDAAKAMGMRAILVGPDATEALKELDRMLERQSDLAVTVDLT